MNRELLQCEEATPEIEGHHVAGSGETGVLRTQLVNLTLYWELAALALDARRYRAETATERESLRDSANAYRKCIAELTKVLAGSSLLACPT